MYKTIFLTIDSKIVVAKEIRSSLCIPKQLENLKLYFSGYLRIRPVKLEVLCKFDSDRVIYYYVVLFVINGMWFL